MSLFDVMGPVMIGPSSSHTAGAVRLGLLARNIAGQPIRRATCHLYNSFAKTWKGHGTDRGIIAGLLGFSVDDERLVNAYDAASQADLAVEFLEEPENVQILPNTVRFELLLESAETLVITGHSLGAGKVLVSQINDYAVNLRGDYPTLVMFYKDQPGMIWQVTKIIAEANINIASLLCSRQEKGEQAFMAIALDTLLPEQCVQQINKIADIDYVRNVDSLPL